MHQPFIISAARTGRYAFAALILSNIFLALGPWMVRLSDVGPVAAGFWRLALAIPLLLLLARGSAGGRSLNPGWALGGMLIVGGFFFASDLASWHYAILRTKLANATLFGNITSFIFAVYGFIVMRQMPHRMQALAFLLAAIGTALLLGNSYELSPQHFEGDLFAMLAGVFYFFYLIAVDRARQTLSPMPVLALATIAGTLPLLIFANFLGEQVMPHNWTPLVLLAVGSQVLGQGLLVYAMGHLNPVVVGLSLLTQPAVSALIGWLAYDERLGATDAIGALLVCAALALLRIPARTPTP